jgi:DNA repair protein RecO (recombination protein O)
MSLHKTDAIILRNSRSGESSLLVYGYLKEGGRVNLLAKGARNPKSVMVGKLEPFSEVELLYYRSSDEKLGVVSQAELGRSFWELSGDIRRLSYASATVESLEAVVPQGESNEQVYSLLQKTLYQLNYCHGSKLDLYFAAYLLKLLSIAGFHPELRRCVKTGIDLTGDDQVYFSAEQGGVISRNAADPEGRYFKLNKGVRKVLELLLATDIDKIGGVSLSAGQKRLVRVLLMRFLAARTERAPALTSLDFLDRIKPDD